MNPIQTRFNNLIHPVRQKLDAKAVEILDDLLDKLPSLKKMMPIRGDEEIVTSCVGFQAGNHNVIIANYDGAMSEFAKEGNLELVKKNQFNTFNENRLYCEGTKGCLLELLIRYRYIETEKAVIASTPDVCIWRQGKASLEPEDLLTTYDEERTVVTTVVFDSGFIAFTFQEKIKLSA